MKGSQYLLRANPLLTTNIKLVCDSNYNLYLESYSVNKELSNEKYKKQLISPDSFISERIANFYKDLPVNIAFDVKNDIVSDNIQTDYNMQFDDVYYSGCKYIEDNRYEEEFQYNTTLKLDPNNLPKYFFIFRTTNPGIENLDTVLFEDIINEDFKIVKSFDLSDKTNLGKLLKKNYIDDDTLPRTNFELNLKNNEFSKWKGYNYYAGGSVEKSLFMESIIQNETTHFELEKTITNGFKDFGVIASNFINISYLFNDTVNDILKPTTYSLLENKFITTYINDNLIAANTYSISGNDITFNTFVPYRKKLTINRYFGFYFNDLKEIDIISPYIVPDLKINDNISIVDNIFEDSIGPVDPVLNGLKNDNPYYIKINKNFYLIDKTIINNVTKYVLISDKKITNQTLLNVVENAQKPIKLVYEEEILGSGIYNTYIKYIDNTYYYNNLFQKYNVLIIKIYDKFYTLKNDKINNKLSLITDELINCDNFKFSRKNGFSSSEEYLINVNNTQQELPYFSIYIPEFTNITDFDFKRINTQYANIENDLTNDVNQNRDFLIRYDINDVSLPIDKYLEKNYSLYIKDINTNINTILYSDSFLLPLSSEYACGDLYVLNNLNKLTEILDLNQSINKLGYSKSINNCSYPYKLNNSYTISGINNFTPNINNPLNSIKEATLDYFYTPGANSAITNVSPYSNSTVLKDTNVLTRTLSIDTEDLLNTTQVKSFYKFDLQLYKDVNCPFNYFDLFFNQNVILTTLNNDVQHFDRISYFNMNDEVNGPVVFFKGINASIYYTNLVDPNLVDLNNNVPATDLVDYGFSILFDNIETTDSLLYGKAGIKIILNKIYKNLLIYIYIYTPVNSTTSLHFKNRDEIYNDNYVKYLTNSGFINSELELSSLSIYNINNILKNKTLIDSNFADNITYEVIEETKKYNINDLTFIYDSLNNKTTITFILNELFDIKETDYFLLNNSGTILDNNNYKIIRKINNKTFIIELIGDFSIECNYIISNSINSLTLEKHKSILPFILDIINPDKIYIDTNYNLILPNDSCPVKPYNNNKTINDLISVSETEIDFVYCEESISRKIKRNLKNDLTYSEILRLPYIYRYSGDYEPITNKINLFNNTKLISLTLSYTSIELFTQLINTKYHYVLKLGSLNSYNFLNVNDIIVIKDVSLIYSELHNRTIYVIDKYILNSDCYYVLSYYAPTDVYNKITNIQNMSSVDFFFYSSIEKNSIFDTVYSDFGMVKDLLVCKVYEDKNPLQTSNFIYNTTNKYPMIDEIGVTSINKYIFKSSWDSNFYYTTITNTYNKL